MALDEQNSFRSIRQRSSVSAAEPSLDSHGRTEERSISEPTTAAETQFNNVRNFKDRFWSFVQTGSETLENNGSVARDHMANERTFLSWIRTSMGLASAGVGVTQLFGLATEQKEDESLFQHNIGKPIGATFILIAILCVIMGLQRFFNVQRLLKGGQYPAARISVFFLVFLVFAITVVTLGAVLYVNNK